MTMYRVVWEIDIEADDPGKAAEKALEIHRNPESIATFFRVKEDSYPGRKYDVDVDPISGTMVTDHATNKLLENI